ncbi:MAG: HAD family phosphatase, partial [Lachnospiraceae bacterium]|nr:HAD family phosphatase [Lachnospiraceae bacterium]
MKKSIVFFDVDGTLWDYKKKIPDSTIAAVRDLRERGHYAFLCTGRTKSTLHAKELLDIGWDGMIAGCGTYIEFEGEILFNRHLLWDEVRRLVPEMKEKGIGAFLEGDEKLYIDWDYYTGSEYAEGFREELQADCLPIEDADDEATINKISIGYMDIPHDEIKRFFGESYDVIIHDFKNPDGTPLNVAEILPRNYSKATGMKWICDYLGIERENTYAFG